MVNYHALDVKKVLSELGTSYKGLTTQKARERLEEYGKNELREEKREGILSLFIDQFKDFLVIILILSALVSFLFGQTNDTIVIGVIVVLNSLLGVFQEYRAEKALQALKKMTSPTARVIRGGRDVEITASEIVPGDILVLETGDLVPADARVIESASLRVDEAALTGESITVSKQVLKIAQEKGVADRTNCIFMGTSVGWGRGKAVVISTGMNTEFGKIAQMVQAAGKEITPLQKKLEIFGKQLGILILVISALISIIGILQGKPYLEMLLTGISLAVAAIPEGLPAVVTITLAIGMQKMAKQNAIVRKLSAVETLGSTSVICSDKTGTLTRNELMVSQIYVNEKVFDVTGVGYNPRGDFLYEGKKINKNKFSDLNLILEIGVLNNDSRHVVEDGKHRIYGDTTEGALMVSAAKAGINADRIQVEIPRISEIPFDSLRKRMTTIHQKDGNMVSYVKGAPELILERCTHILQGGKVRKLTSSEKNKVKAVYSNMAANALRVLGFAYKNLPKSESRFDEQICEEDLVFVGLQGMIDLPRKEAKTSIEVCRKAGIRVMMITGDHKLTAVAIARQLNMIDGDGRAVSGDEVDKLSDKQLIKLVREVSVFARVSPEHKLRVVQALKSTGHIVAVTGDGVNDAPSLKEAQIGVSMGITGTDVAKEASDMILTDDNFSTIVGAVEEGRRIYDNIRKFVRYLLAANLSEVLIILCGTLMGLPVPLKPIQILWINLVTDGLPALALGVEPTSPGIMDKNPRNSRENILSRSMISSITVIGIAGAIVTLAVFIYQLGQSDLVKARTMAFTTLMFFEMFVVFVCRSETLPLQTIGFFSNPWLLLSVLISLILQISVLQIPFLQQIFGVIPLGFSDWIFVVLVSSIVFVAEELYKIQFDYSRKLGRIK